MEDVCRKLAPLKEQENVEGFLNNVQNVDKLGGLVEDIRDAMMEYQVWSLYSFASTPNVHIRLRCNKISTTRAVDSS